MAKFGLPGGRRTRQPQQKARTAGDVRLALNFALDTDQARGSAVVFSGSPERVTNPLGVARKFDAQAKYATITRVGGPLIQTGNFSIIYQFKMLGAPINGGLMVQIPGTSGNNNLMNLYTLDTGVIRCDMCSASGSAVTIDSAVVVVAGGTYTVELINNNGTLQFYVNGATSGGTLAMPARDGESTTIRVTNGGADATPNHEVTLVAFRGGVTVLGRNPWRIFQPRKRELYVKASGGVSGTIATTMDAFTSSITGTTTIVGSMAQTTADAVSSITGSTTIVGSMTQTLGNDVGALQGTTTIVGSMAVTAQNDTASMAGTTTIVGSMGASTENATSTITATTTILGTMAQTMTDFVAAMYGSSGVEAIVAKLRAMIGVGQ